MSTGSVGRYGLNRHDDVGLGQSLLKRAGMDPGPIDHIADRRIIAAIVGFQQRFLTRPDGRVDVGGITLARLQSGAVRAAPRHMVQPDRVAAFTVAPRSGSGSGGEPKNWTGDSSKWPQDKKLASLEPGFRRKIEALLQTLRAQGFGPDIVFGWRSVAVQQQLTRRGVTKVRFSFHNAQTPQGRPNAWAVDIVDER